MRSYWITWRSGSRDSEVQPGLRCANLSVYPLIQHGSLKNRGCSAAGSPFLFKITCIRKRSLRNSIFAVLAWRKIYVILMDTISLQILAGLRILSMKGQHDG